MNIPKGYVDFESVQWVETSENFDLGYTYQNEWWVRRTPMARAWGNRFIPGCEDWSHRIVNEHGQLVTGASWDHCMLSPLPKPLDWWGLIWEAVIPCVNPVVASRDSQAPRGKWTASEDQLEGNNVIRYEREVVKGHFLVKTSCWADPETGWLVRREVRESDLASGKALTSMVLDQYRFDVEAPPGTFEMPPEKPIKAQPSLDKDIMTPVWQDMSEAQRDEVRGVIAALDKSWKEADFASFSALWKFGEVRGVPSMQDWQALIQGQKAEWTAWSQEITDVVSWKMVWVRIGDSSFTIGAGGRKSFQVKTKLKASRKTSAKSWAGEAEVWLYLRDDKAGGNGPYEIVHWELPLLEIRSRLPDEADLK